VVRPEKALQATTGASRLLPFLQLVSNPYVTYFEKDMQTICPVKENGDF